MKGKPYGRTVGDPQANFKQRERWLKREKEKRAKKPDAVMETVRHAVEGEEIQKAPFVFRSIGPAVEHNYYCAVCRQAPAVLETWWGVLQPCWECQEKGYTRIKRFEPGSLAAWFWRWLWD